MSGTRDKTQKCADIISLFSNDVAFMKVYCDTENKNATFHVFAELETVFSF